MLLKVGVTHFFKVRKHVIYSKKHYYLRDSTLDSHLAQYLRIHIKILLIAVSASASFYANILKLF